MHLDCTAGETQVSNLSARVALAALGCVLSATALATNGYFPHGFSLSQKALGGAGTALGIYPVRVACA